MPSIMLHPRKVLCLNFTDTFPTSSIIINIYPYYSLVSGSSLVDFKGYTILLSHIFILINTNSHFSSNVVVSRLSLPIKNMNPGWNREILCFSLLSFPPLMFNLSTYPHQDGSYLATVGLSISSQRPLVLTSHQCY